MRWPWGALNLVMTNGESAAASRITTGPPDKAASLYVHAGSRYTCDGGVCRMLDADSGSGAVLVCSEPLSDDPGWDPVPPNHWVLVDGARRVTLRPSR